MCGDGRLLALYFCPLSSKTPQKSCAVQSGTPTSIKKNKFLSESQLSSSDWSKVGFFNRLVSGNLFTGILWFGGGKFCALFFFLMCPTKITFKKISSLGAELHNCSICVRNTRFHVELHQKDSGDFILSSHVLEISACWSHNG